ncbi:MAG: hypothetical protein KGQ59_00425 [Bdellovibrionales bacterium]|nr:hypothetical protein [Bdellovibrionales bacterium]
MSDPFPPSSSTEMELQRAYNGAIDVGVTHFWNRSPIPGVHADEIFTLYKRAWSAYQRGTPQDRLLAERWARAVKHLAIALCHEAKMHYLEPRSKVLPEPSVTSQAQEAATRAAHESALALLDAASERIQKSSLTPGVDLDTLNRLLNRGRTHLEQSPPLTAPFGLLRQQRIQAAHEYGRALEYLLLAVECEAELQKANGPAISRQAAA